MIVFTERLIEIAAVTVTQYGGDFFYGKIRAFQQTDRPVHPLFQKNF